MINNVNPKDRDLAMVFQSYALYPHMTVYQNIAFALKLAGMPKSEIDKRVRAAADLLHLDELLDRKPKALSGGQRQRVAMGRAMVRTPKLFLFDEPLSNLDAKLRGKMRAEIKSLHRELMTTTLYVTHDQVEAMTLADRIVIMDKGVISQIGTPEEVFCRPANRFVAGFIGSPPMNFFPAALRQYDKQWVLECEGVELPLPERFHQGAANGQQVDVGIRPTDMHLRAEQVPHANVAQLVVDLVDTELLGANMLLNCQLGKQSLQAEIPTEPLANKGSQIDLFLDLEALHVFDLTSGNSLAKS